jgi:hypothetical protein
MNIIKPVDRAYFLFGCKIVIAGNVKIPIFRKENIKSLIQKLVSVTAMNQ